MTDDCANTLRFFWNQEILIGANATTHNLLYPKNAHRSRPRIRLHTQTSTHSTHIPNPDMTSDSCRLSQSIHVCQPDFTKYQQELAVPPSYPCQQGGLSPCLITTKLTLSSSKANATWYQGQTQPRTKSILLKKDLLGLSLHSAKEALTHCDERQVKVKTSSSKSLQPKSSSLKDDPEVTNLLQMLQTTNFVGEIDPIYHSRYVDGPTEEEPKLTVRILFDLKEVQQNSTSIKARHNSDEYLHSPMQTTKRGLRL
jgi:hypothetical protein